MMIIEYDLGWFSATYYGKLNTTLCSDLHPAQCGQSESFFYIKCTKPGILPCSYGKWKGRVPFQGFFPGSFFFTEKMTRPGMRNKLFFFLALHDMEVPKKEKIHEYHSCSEPQSLWERLYRVACNKVIYFIVKLPHESYKISCSIRSNDAEYS